MGKGDRRTRRGKLSIGSYGNTRKRSSNTSTDLKKTKPAAKPKKSGDS